MKPLTSRLQRDESGAIVVFGIFFAIIILGFLYYFVGLAAVIHLRERMQDAADASAFAAAVVHARGMNVLALINMIMAAIMSVLVTLRIIELLIIIAQVILYLLSWLGGATAAIASALEVVRQTVTRIADNAEPVIQNVIKVLHYTGDVVRVITPVGANLTVIGKVAGNYGQELLQPVGAIAIPARLTLPVEDDQYSYLCGKAGAMAATLVMLPFQKVLPGKVRAAVGEKASALTSGGSAWFCGEGDPPEVDVDPGMQKYPQSQDMKDCVDPNKQDKDSIEVCHKAEQEESLGEPNEEDGTCRIGDFACNAERDTSTEPPTRFEFEESTWCYQTGQDHVITEEECDGTVVPDRQNPIPSLATAYGRRLDSARTECKPDGKKRDFWWIERTVEVAWDAKSESWKRVENGEVPPERSVKPTGDNEHFRGPCDEPIGPFGRWAPATREWNTGDLAAPVCSIDPPPPPLHGELRGTRREVLQVLGCNQEVQPYKKLAVKPVNVSQDKVRESTGIGDPNSESGGKFKNIKLDEDQTMESSSSATSKNADGSDNDGSNDMVPFRFEKKHKLGTSDMQIRSLVMSKKLGDPDIVRGTVDEENSHEHAQRVVEISKWGSEEGGLQTLRDASQVYGRFAVAQAEYYFDVDSRGGAEGNVGDASPFAIWNHKDDEHPENGSRDYLWYMGWTARMRRFRLKFGDADGESESGADSRSNSELTKRFGGGDGKQGLGGDQKSGADLAASGPEIPCLGISVCEEIKPLVSSFDSLFLH